MSTSSARSLAERIDALLPQTQCRKCGFDGCRPYAESVAAGLAEINRCPPGGAAGIEKLGAVTGRAPLPLDPARGVERPLRVAVIDEALCIGCTLCIQACPVDAIIGATRHMHTVISTWCNGCDLCVEPCPMDCIAMVPVEPARPWTEADACGSRARYEARAARYVRERIEREQRLVAKALAKLDELERRTELTAKEAERKKAVVRAAIDRARARRASAKP